MNSATVTNILVAGIGGQGVMTAAEILSETAMSLGFDVKKTEVAGMAQRGGVVTSHVRFGQKVHSPSIAAGEADVLVAFEPAEALRWVTHLRPEGVAMVNTFRLAPPVVSIGLFDYPDDPVTEMKTSKREVHAFNAGALALELGDRRLVNTIMLGAIADQLPFDAEVLKASVLKRFQHKSQALLELNQKAFEAGRTAAKQN
ncbi:indolepyruvate ferredoxin oxidoreductase beta subunit [Oceanospirillum multiglobuliferum]|uniref:Indolepyruvate oxidoreductase n=1 Tax=Oceanospirillum multiglobuliferum TaxID=64969 RepID=A0A1T4PSA1_9GAMM|nr:indolepyruvate oxidoreductase subunit beta [Oceanospirillum multiglobuliferum]OPX55339.1 indolepyruvate oxidoreductase [Oceanospirillum multiglobuliferum]SJZ94435.1 indolepyruvate ferredoxin oxidoreductase beta subunit [Oceanospirillum multiglobuliferum]